MKQDNSLYVSNGKNLILRSILYLILKIENLIFFHRSCYRLLEKELMVGRQMARLKPRYGPLWLWVIEDWFLTKVHSQTSPTLENLGGGDARR